LVHIDRADRTQHRFPQLRNGLTISIPYEGKQPLLFGDKAKPLAIKHISHLPNTTLTFHWN
jgi:hypothetical protein